MILFDKKSSDLNAYADKLYYTSSCRVGFRHLLRHLDFQEKNILLPGYIGVSMNEGSGVFDPIIEFQINYDFYRVNRDLSVDMGDFKSKVVNSNVGAVLLIHYFGFVQSEVNAIVNLCRENNVLLIEDCAHSLTSSYYGVPLGSLGDFGLFSLHKTLPVSSGGILRVNNKKYFFIPPLEDSERIPQNVLESFCSSRLTQISHVRRRNFLLLARYLKGLDGIEVLHPKLNDGIVPQSFPILINNQEREKVYFAMIEKGVRVIALYYQLIEQITLQDHPVACDLSSRILNLPIHQDLSPNNIRLMADILSDVIQAN
jgi:dTDP-4-amino-4,6-dideoxygalactose transaminase